MNNYQRERLRRQYCPDEMRILMVGEAPPASGRFFYCGNSGLFRAIREAFCASSMPEAAFLETFRNAGCYLVDLCPEPVDRLSAALRRSTCAANETALARTVARLNPPLMITLLRSIEQNVLRAAARAHWNGTMVHLPYPGRWARRRHEFVETLAPIAARLILDSQAGT